MRSQVQLGNEEILILRALCDPMPAMLRLAMQAGPCEIFVTVV